MSTVATAISLAQAEREAEAFRALFPGCWAFWSVAGSVRRKKGYVNDIEHVVVPQGGVVPGPDRPPAGLFDAVTSDGFSLQTTRAVANLMRERIHGMIEDRRSGLTLHRYGQSGRNRAGEKYVGLDWHDRLHEVFFADRDNLGLILAIRTGPGEFSKDLVVRLRRNRYRAKDGKLWRQVAYPVGSTQKAPGWLDEEHGAEWRVVPAADEATVFRAAGYESVIDPALRQ